MAKNDREDLETRARAVGVESNGVSNEELQRLVEEAEKNPTEL